MSSWRTRRGFRAACSRRCAGRQASSAVAPIWIGLGEWRSRESRERWNIMTLGVDPDERPFRDRAINDRLPLLQTPDTALADTRSRPEHGPLDPGVASEVQHHRIRIVGQYAIGAGFVAGATMVTSRETFLRIFEEADAEQVNAGLVRLASGVPAETAAGSLNQRLWPEAVAVTRADLSRAEQRYWLNVKPIGIMFTSGVMVAFIAGAVVLYQVLASEVQNRLREYATLKALGYSDPQVYGVVVRQALLFAGLGFIPAFLLSLVLYFLLRTQAQIPVSMDPGRAAGVAALVALMCLSATMLARAEAAGRGPGRPVLNGHIQGRARTGDTACREDAHAAGVAEPRPSQTDAARLVRSGRLRGPDHVHGARVPERPL